MSILPSSIAILKADCCGSLESIGDLSDYKWLWKVSLTNCDRLIGRERALLSMLEANEAADRFMSVYVNLILEPSNIYVRLVTLQLPHNWYSDFSGFLLVLHVGMGNFKKYKIVIKQEMSTSHSEKFNKDRNRYAYERVGYLPFSSLRHIPWLNPICTQNISFHTIHCAFSVSLVRSTRNISDINEHPIDCSECWDEEYEGRKPFKIVYDSKSSEI
ncbi:hypothetical protein M8C21_004851, partial [Ambrosia artemisiifolia]